MFRQLLLLVSLIALATAQSAYYSHGERQEGDKLIEIIHQETELTESSGIHVVNVRVSEVERLLTYVQYNVLEGFDHTFSYGIGQIKLTNYNTTQLTVTTYVYGFNLEQTTTILPISGN